MSRAPGVLLARRWWPREDVPCDVEVWWPRKTACPVPPGTRFVRFGVHARRFTGTELSQYWDDMGPVEFKSLSGYLAKLIDNKAVFRFLSQRQPDVLAEFENIVQTVTLDGK